jgi:hypothetical protein
MREFFEPVITKVLALLQRQITESERLNGSKVISVSRRTT